MAHGNLKKKSGEIMAIDVDLIESFIKYGITYNVPIGMSNSERNLWQEAVISAKEDILKALREEFC